MAYKMAHPESEQEISVDLDQVPMYQSQGWETKPGARLPASEDD